jgi:hypothetical protein
MGCMLRGLLVVVKMADMDERELSAEQSEKEDMEYLGMPYADWLVQRSKKIIASAKGNYHIAPRTGDNALRRHRP